jgi:hypothetical protein
MGGISTMVSSMFGGEKKPKMPEMPAVPDYEAERKKAAAAAAAKRASLADKGMSGALLGGSMDEDGAVKKHKLLGG